MKLIQRYAWVVCVGMTIGHEWGLSMWQLWVSLVSIIVLEGWSRDGEPYTKK